MQFLTAKVTKNAFDHCPIIQIRSNNWWLMDYDVRGLNIGYFDGEMLFYMIRRNVINVIFKQAL